MATEAEQRERALTSLCVGKCRDMDLTNHRTAWNALGKLPSPHKEMLKRMGYGRIPYIVSMLIFVVLVPHNFHIQRFGPNNGTRGTLPVTPAEWIPDNRLTQHTNSQKNLERKPTICLLARFNSRSPLGCLGEEGGCKYRHSRLQSDGIPLPVFYRILIRFSQLRY